MTQTLTVYSTPTCGFCHMLKSYLKQKDIDYEEKDITEDRAAYERVVSLTGMAAVPVTTVGDDFVIGFDRPKIDKLLTQTTK